MTRWSAQSIVLRDFAAKTIDSTDLLNLDHPLQEKPRLVDSNLDSVT